MMPKVTEWLRPKGLPTASTKSPISMRSLSPSGAGTRSRRLDLHHGHVRLRRRPRPAGMDPPAVAQVDADGVGRGVADHVPIGEHVVLAPSS